MADEEGSRIREAYKMVLYGEIMQPWVDIMGAFQFAPR
jgi:hypothetical protein